ncbi:MAG: glycosyltransferase family 39 protein, partial [Candidatus Omnitrophota bacterium]|nr:glycosyltransferase family 39 protein [Candidatus Omnitrophota bacterium]
MKRFIARHPGWAVFFAVLLVRLAAIAVGAAMRLCPTPLEHEVIVSNWLRGEGFTYFHLGTIYKSLINPFYSFLCVIIYKIMGHHYLGMLITQTVFSGFLCVCVYHIGSLIDKPTGFTAALLTMLHPGIAYYDLLYLHPLSMDAFFFAFVIFMFMKVRASPAVFNLVITGLALGLQMYERGTIAFFVLPAMIWLYYFQEHRETFMTWFKRSVLIGAIMILLVAPWTIRNYVIHKQLIPICTTISEVLWRGNNPLATGTAYSANGTPMFFSAPMEFQNKITSLDEI